MSAVPSHPVTREEPEDSRSAAIQPTQLGASAVPEASAAEKLGECTEEKLDEIDTVKVQNGVKLKPGVRICKGLVVGKILSHGVQGEVSLVVDEEGEDTDWLLKVTFLKNAFDDMEREWMVGRTLNLLNNPTFMFTGPALREPNGEFVGMLLRKIHGTTCDKVVQDRSFVDVRWLQKCLFTTLMAMDQAQKVLGFHHYDLRLGNVMVEGASEEEWRDPARATFRIIDFGLGAFDEGYMLLPSDNNAVKQLVAALSARAAQKAQKAQEDASPGNTSLMSVLKMPVSMPKLLSLGKTRSRTSSNDHSPTTGSSSITAAAATATDDGSAGAAPAGAAASTAAGSDGGDSGNAAAAQSTAAGDTAEQAVVPETAPNPEAKAAGGEPVVWGNDALAKHSRQEAPGEDSHTAGSRGLSHLVPVGEVTQQSWSGLPFGRGDPVPQFVTSTVFQGYRQFWQHRGDLLYLCFSLVSHLDFRTWPRCDELLVRRLMNFIHHVTGICLRVLFAADMSKVKRVTKDRWWFLFRKAKIRYKAMIHPYNAGLTAAESLCAPFFADLPLNPYGLAASCAAEKHCRLLARAGRAEPP